MSDTKIILGSREFAVEAVPLGRLKRLVPSLTAFSRAVALLGTEREMSEADMDHAVKAISAGLGISVEEVEAMPATLEQLIDAVGVLAQVSGLTPKGDVPSGEAMPGVTPATASTLLTG